MLNEDNSFCCSPIIDVAVITYKASGKTYGKNLDTKILQVYCKATSFRVREFSRGLQEPGHCKSSSPYSYFFLRMFVLIRRLWMSVLLPKLVVANSFIPGNSRN